MTQQVAVRSFEDMVNHFDKLKRDALFFDRIAVSELTTKAAAWASQSDYTSVEAQKLADLPWLVDQGILFDPNTTLNDRDLMDIAVHRDYLNARAAVQDQLHTLIGRLTGDEPKDRTLVVDPNRMEVNAGLSSQECKY